MTNTKFAYPDLPPMVDRKIYDYYYQIDRLLRQFGTIISELETNINSIQQALSSLPKAS